MGADTTPLTVRDAHRALRDGSTTSVALTEAMLARADRLDGDVGTYIARFDEPALESAARADRELASGVDRGPLHGIPVGVKDILACREGPTTAQSLVLDPAWGAGRDAVAVSRLRDAGAVITGKTTTMEFAVGMFDPTKPFPVARNPWDLAAWPGGSSSGSANGVAAGLFLAAVGTDTGGSIRIPSALCGVNGLKPTYSRIPTSGCVPLGYTLDHIGALARTAWDCGAMLGAMAGHHPTDPSSSERPVPDYLGGLGSIDGLRVGVVREPHLVDAPDFVVQAYDDLIATLTDLGAVTHDVTVPHFHEVGTASLVISTVEGATYHHPDLGPRWDDYNPATRSIFAWGAMLSGADYVQAQRVRRVGQRSLAELFRRADVILTPTATVTAPTYEAMEREGMFGILSRIHTPYWSTVGNPALVLPMGFSPDGMPLSAHLAARPFDEATLIRLGDAYQQRTDWHLRVPDLVAGAASR